MQSIHEAEEYLAHHQLVAVVGLAVTVGASLSLAQEVMDPCVHRRRPPPPNPKAKDGDGSPASAFIGLLNTAMVSESVVAFPLPFLPTATQPHTLTPPRVVLACAAPTT